MVKEVKLIIASSELYSVHFLKRVGLIADSCLNKSADGKFISRLLYCTEMSYFPIVFMTFFSAAAALFMTLTFDKDKKIASEEKSAN